MKIRLKIFLVFSLIALTITAVNYFSYNQEKRSLTIFAQNHLQAIASLQKSRIESLNNMSIEQFELVSSRTQLRKSLKTFLNENSLNDQKRMNKILRDALVATDYFEQIDIYSFDGTIVASTNLGVIGTSVPFEYLHEQPKEISLHFSREDHTVKERIEGPLVLKDTVLALMAVYVNPQNLLDIVDDHSGLGKTGETILAIQQEDQSAIILTPTRYNRDAALSHKILSTDDNIAMNRVFQGETGFLDSIYDYRGEPIWAVPHLIKGVNWGLVVKMDKAEVFEPVVARQRVVVTFSILALVIIFLAFIFLDNSLVGPITLLTKYAKKVRGGDYQTKKVTLRRHDEIGVLNTVFNAMTDNIIATLDEMNSKVVELKKEVAYRKEIQSELMESELKFTHLFDHSPIGLALCDMKGKLISINPKYAEIIGYSVEEAMQLSYWEITPRKYESLEQEQLHHLLDTQGYGPFEKEYIHKDGHLVPVRLNGIIVSRRGKNYIWSSVEDITKQKLLENQLLQSQKMESIGSLAAGIAHEINTPIQYVGDNIKFLEDSFGLYSSLYQKINDIRDDISEELQEYPKLSEMYQMIEDNDFAFLQDEIPDAVAQSIDGVERVSSIVGAMKQFSHPHEEKVISNINSIIENSIIVCKNEWKYVADLTTNLEKASPDLPLFPTDISQVLINMIINASHAIEDSVANGEKGKIKIATHSNDDSIFIELSDTGAGIAPENYSRVFDHFFTTKEVGRGTGQGLSMAYDIITSKHNGELSFTSELNVGTTFTIRLPLN